MPPGTRAALFVLALLAWSGVAVGRGIVAQEPGALDRYAASDARFVPVGPEPHSGPRRAKRAKEILSDQSRALVGYQDQSPWLVGFYCPMHPDITSKTEANCSRCGMKLVPGDPLDAREYLVDMKATPQAVRPGRPVQLTFTVRHPDTRTTVRSFATVHEKQFHLFVVSHDLEYYDHVHPDMQADGSWTIDLTVPKAGYYKLFADFLPLGGTPQVVPRLLAAGDPGDLAAARARLPSDDGFEKTAGSMDVALSLPDDGLVAGRDETLRYHIVDARTGKPVTNLEPYLAAYGHTLVLSEDTMEYVHAHPVEQLPEKIDTAAGGPDLTFKALLPKPGRYRLWTQLKRGGVVSTARFTVTAASPVGR